MFDPHAHIFDAVLKAIFAATLVAMAGGFPCCCSEGDGSTTSTSTSTQPPIPPGSTSTSTGYVVPRFACQWCIDSATVASQYQVEVAGFADAYCFCDAVNGVYFIETLSDGGYSDATFFLITGCGKHMYDFPDFECYEDEITEDPVMVEIDVGFVAAGNNAGSSPLQTSITWFGIHFFNAVDSAIIHGYEFQVTHAGPQADATGTVDCDTISGTVLPLTNEFPFGTICDVSAPATATPTEFTGF